MRMFRQGDVLLIQRAEEIAGHAIPESRVDGRIVLAEGEATGHAHAISSSGAELLQVGERRLLKVSGEPVDVIHEEHAIITVPIGIYEVVRQREFSYDRPDRTVFD
jgi:hypothetical protein